jgi:hypothetical protein
MFLQNDHLGIMEVLMLGRAQSMRWSVKRGVLHRLLSVSPGTQCAHSVCEGAGCADE